MSQTVRPQGVACPGGMGFNPTAFAAVPQGANGNPLANPGDVGPQRDVRFPSLANGFRFASPVRFDGRSQPSVLRWILQLAQPSEFCLYR
jgi:hypothetical protein